MRGSDSARLGSDRHLARKSERAKLHDALMLHTQLSIVLCRAMLTCLMLFKVVSVVGHFKCPGMFCHFTLHAGACDMMSLAQNAS